MAQPKRVSKSVTYKFFKFNAEPLGESAKTLLAKAIKKHNNVGLRRFNVGDSDNPIYHVVGDTRDEERGFVFGILMTYTPGTDPLFVVDDTDAPDVLIEQLRAPTTESGKRREMLESTLYFGAYENHLVVVQSQALKAAQLEAYLRWFLHGSAVLENTNSFQLIDTPPKAAREKMAKGQGVKSIVLGGEVLPRHSVAAQPHTVAPVAAADHDNLQPSAAGGQQRVHVQTLATVGGDVAEWGLLAALKKLLSPAQAAKIDFDQIDGTNIEMSITLKYARQTSEDGQKLLDSLGAALRNVDEADTVLHLNGGGTLRGEELKLTGKVQLTSYSGQINSTEVFEALRQWLISKIQTEEVPAS